MKKVANEDSHGANENVAELCGSIDFNHKCSVFRNGVVYIDGKVITVRGATVGRQGPLQRLGWMTVRCNRA